MMNFISVGIDVAAEFSFMTILSPTMERIGNPFKIFAYNDESLKSAVKLIKKAEKAWSVNSHIYMESTGIYHLPLFCYLKESGLEAFVLNPLITDSTKNSAIRKVKADKIDSMKIARLGFTPNLKVSIMPTPLVMYLRSLVREYFSYSDQKTAFTNKLSTFLVIAFPGYNSLFDELTGKTSLAILKNYSGPQAILDADPSELIGLIKAISNHGDAYVQMKYQKLLAIAQHALSYGMSGMYPYSAVLRLISSIEYFENQLDAIKSEIEEYLLVHERESFVEQINLLKSLSGIQSLSASALMCEIGDFSQLSKPKELSAYFGVDCAVRESGAFKGDRVAMTKRGSSLARRVLFNIVLCNIRKSKSGNIMNPVLYEEYHRLLLTKKKKVAIGVLMHKLCLYIFAILRDSKPYEIRTKEEHKLLYMKSHSDAA